MKNKTKIFAVLCMIAVLALTMCVSAFADDVLDGEILRVTVNGAEVEGTYADELVISPTENIQVKVEDGGQVVYDDIAYKVVIQESALGIEFLIYDTVEAYLDLSPTYQYNSNNLSTVVFEFIGLTSYSFTPTEGITVELISPNYTVNSITGVFSAMTSFIIGGINLVQPVFYANGGLTLLGSLAVIALAVGIAFLIIGVIQKFLALRG